MPTTSDNTIDSKLQCPRIWSNHAIQSERDREYLAATAQAQISIALSLQRIAEALEKQPEFRVGFWENTANAIENPDMQHSTQGFTGDSPVGDVRAADPFDGVCERCGWEFKHIAHDEKYGSHKFKLSPYKSIGEWREAHKNDA